MLGNRNFPEGEVQLQTSAATRLVATDFIRILLTLLWPHHHWLEEVLGYVAMKYDMARSGHYNTENNFFVSWWNSETYI